MHDDDIPTQPPTFDGEAGPPTEAPVAEERVAAAPVSELHVRKWIGAGIGVVAIVLAALFGTGAISSYASTAGDQGGRQFPGGGGGQFPGGGGFRGGGGFPGGGQFQAPGPQQVVPSAPTTTAPPTLSPS
jgi:hypothetical protein